MSGNPKKRCLVECSTEGGESGPPKKKGRRLSLSLKTTRAAEERFHVSSAKDLETASKKAVPKNTATALNWAFRLYRDWVTHSSQVDDRTVYSVEDLWSCDDPAKLSEMLSRFCLEIKQQNGNPYTPKSLLQILINLQSYARSKDQGCLNFMNTKDQRFTQVHTVLDNLSRTLHKEGVGATKIQARVVTVSEEEELWRSGVMGCDSPRALQNAVFYLCGIYLCLRGGDEHRELKVSQFVIEEVDNPQKPSEKIELLTYTENGSKNHSGAMHQVHLENKIVKHYTNSSLGSRCFVYVVKLYISKLHEKSIQKDVFYCKPVKQVVPGKPWYYDMPVGHNILKKKLKDMFTSAGLPNENISNHSLRATGVTRMYDQEKIIMERSGHLSTSGVRSYERTTCLQQKEVSDVLSSKSAYMEEREPLKEFTLNKSEGSCPDTTPSDQTSDQVSDLMKQFNFQAVHGCTFNFNFSSK